MSNLWEMPAHELARLIRRREVASEEVVSAHLSRIEAVNPSLHAVVQMRPDGARADALRADRELMSAGPRGPLHGVPFTVKDWIETNDLPCAAGLEERREYVPKHDATVVARLRAAGAILLGKTKPGADEDLYPRARNPYALDRTPGASSGGEAAIIAAGGSPFGLGSDSGGSIRWPAHCCGLAALKPTFGLVPATGHFPRVNPMSDPRTVIGPLARSVQDVGLVLSAMAGPDSRDPGAVPVALGDPGSVDIAGLRVAYHTAFPGAAPSADVVAVCEAAARALVSAGATVVEALPPNLEESLRITMAYWARVSSVSLTDWRPSRPARLSATEIEESLFAWDRFRRATLRFMEAHDLVLSPVAAAAAPSADTSPAAEDYLYMLPYSLTGQPVAVVRAGTSAEGLPLGVQLAARNWSDHVALGAAAMLESALGGWRPLDGLHRPGD